MKRSTRTIDVPKLRRNLKGRGRIAETMCCGGFAYVKLALLWLCCIALDLLIGFRFELLYPFWLLIRNCYDSFRFQGLVSSLQYSAFSAFFVCATVTTDLICFIFIPVQLLIFLASTYVWVLFVWHTAERGIGSAQLILSIALITFEYNWRYRGDPPLQLLRGSTLGSALNFLTGGLLTNWLGLRDGPTGEIVESSEQSSSRECQPPPARVFGGAVSTGGFLGGFGIALAAAFARSSLTSDLCRPFAAHCIGYPVVTFGFGLKTYLRLWRVKRRQREVSRANEVYSKLLTEALPSLYEGPKMLSRFRGAAALREQEQLEYESEICPGSLAICGAPPTASITQRKNSRSGCGWKQNGWKQSGPGVKRASLSANGTLARKDRISSLNNEDDDTASSVSVSVTPRMYLWRFLWDLLRGVVLYIWGHRTSDSPSSSLDDRVSLSSNEIDTDEELLEQEETSSQPEESNRLRAGANKKNKSTVSWNRSKGGRSRGRNSVHSNSAEYVLSPLTSGTLSPPLGATCPLSNNLLNLASAGAHERQMYSSAVSPGHANLIAGDAAAISNPAIGVKQLDSGAEELETLRHELQNARYQESELRCTLQQYVSTEKQLKAELSQLKQKQEQSDNKMANLVKAREQEKSSMQLLEKRLIEAQTKKNELEKELSAEKRSKVKEEYAAARALAAAQSIKSAECSDACRSRKADLERELRGLRRDVKAKEDLIGVVEEQSRQLRQYKENYEELQTAVIKLREKNVHLEKSLSAENRLKQELFRALSEARSQTAEYQQQLHAKDMDLRMKETELMSIRSHLSGETNSSPNLSPSGDIRTTVMNASAGTRCCVTQMSNGAGLKSTLSAEQGMDMFTAALAGGSANGPYMPYQFASRNTSSDCSMFETPVTQSAQAPKMSSSSVSPPPAGAHLAGPSTDNLRYNSSKYGPTTAAN